MSKLTLGSLRLVINVAFLSVSSYLYWKCIQTLRTSPTITRKKLLTNAFAANLAFWALTVVPHVAFEDFVMRGDTPNFALFLEEFYEHNDLYIDRSHLYLSMFYDNEEDIPDCAHFHSEKLIRTVH